MSLCLCMGLLLTAPRARAEAPVPSPPARVTREVCIKSHELSQELRLDDKFVEARRELLLCADAQCPAALRIDCTRWLDELETLTPSVLFAARSERGDESDVEVWVDEQRVWERLSGRALELNPGPHQLRFRMAGRAERRQFVLLREGERGRVVTADFTPAAKATPTEAAMAPIRMTRPTPPLVYWLGGLSLASLAGAAYFGTEALLERNSARDECSPVCDKSRMSGIRADALTADLLGGLGLGSAAVAALLYINRPSVPVTKAVTHLPFTATTDGHSAWLQWGGAF